MDLELPNLQHIIVLNLKARAVTAAAHASQNIEDVPLFDQTFNSQRTTKLTLAQKVEIIRRYVSPDDVITKGELASIFQVPLSSPFNIPCVATRYSI
jgi:hypothetical protein